MNNGHNWASCDPCTPGWLMISRGITLPSKTIGDYNNPRTGSPELNQDSMEWERDNLWPLLNCCNRALTKEKKPSNIWGSQSSQSIQLIKSDKWKLLRTSLYELPIRFWDIETWWDSSHVKPVNFGAAPEHGELIRGLWIWLMKSLRWNIWCYRMGPPVDSVNRCHNF